MTINVALVSFIAVAILFVGLGHYLNRRLGLPSALPYNLGAWLAAASGGIYAGFDLKNWWAATAGLAAVGAVYLSWQVVYARMKAGRSR